MNFQPLEILLPNQESANRSLQNPTTAVKQENMQQAPKLSMEQRVGALDRFYRLPDGTSQHVSLDRGVVQMIPGDGSEGRRAELHQGAGALPPELGVTGV